MEFLGLTRGNTGSGEWYANFNTHRPIKVKKVMLNVNKYEYQFVLTLRGKDTAYAKASLPEVKAEMEKFAANYAKLN